MARDGKTWSVGHAADVAWINAVTTVGTAITSAIPAVFDAYATIELPQDLTGQSSHDAALLPVLSGHVIDQQWWLGYLDTGADDVVFPSAPRVTLYAGLVLRPCPCRARAGFGLASLGSRLVLVGAPTEPDVPPQPELAGLDAVG